MLYKFAYLYLYLLDNRRSRRALFDCRTITYTSQCRGMC